MADVERIGGFLIGLAARKAVARAAVAVAPLAALGWGIDVGPEAVTIHYSAFFAALGAWALVFAGQAWKHYLAPRLGRAK